MVAAAHGSRWVLLLALLAPAVRAAELVVEWAPLAVSVESYQVERRVADPRDAFVPIARVAGDVVRFTDTHAAAGVRYCYRVRGVRGLQVSPPSPELCSVAIERAAGAPSATQEPPAEAHPVAPPPAIADRDVEALRRPPPEYPRELILGEISGWVKLKFTVTAEGTTRDIQVVAAEPPGVFDQAALDAAAGFVYSPRIEDGLPVDRPDVETEISFSWIGGGGAVVTGRRLPAPR